MQDDRHHPQITVLYCDLVGSTGLAERFDAEDLREIVRDYQAVSVAEIDRHGGFTAQYHGDGILAYFGYPEPREDDAERAVHAGLGIIGAVTALNERIEAGWSTRLAVRIGIHSGEVATAEVEGTHLIHGPTPQLAARLQQLAEPNGIAVSAAIHERSREAFPFRPILLPDGNQAPLKAFRVEASAPAVEPARAADEGDAERRQLTVMFCELVGRDEDELSLSADLEDLEELTSIVVDFQSACAGVVERFGGHVAQYLGDGLMAYFGFPVAHEDAVRRAVLAGLGILETVARQTGEDYPWTVRLGLHTGPVVAGEVGAGETRERLALGTTPNVAARVLGLAGPGELVISQATYHLVEGFFLVESRGEHLMKGLSEPTEIFRVRERSGVRNPFEVALSRGLTPIMGRQAELAALVASLHRVRDGHAEAFLIHGEAGIGKSRLLYALVERATGYTRWFCRCSPYAQGSPFEPVIDLFQRILESYEEAPEHRVRSLEDFVEGLGLLSDEAVSLLAGLLSLPLPPRYPELILTPQLQKQKTLELCLEILFRAARQSPLLFVVEDLHWIDPSTLEFLGLLLERPEGRLLTVLTSRPSEVPSWPSPAIPLTEISLGSLDEDQAVAILRHLAGGKALPPQVERQVVERADGIPLFIEELVKMLLESGALRENEHGYELTGPLSSLAIPTSVHDLLTARLDRLSTAKELLQWGAVVGREFTHEMLLAVSGLESETLEDRLRIILETGLVLREGTPPRAAYVFKHALVQDAAYDSLLRRQRQRYHGRVATVLTESFPEILEQRPQVVALHFTHAGQTEAAIDYWQRAAQRDFQRAAFGEAADHLRQGLRLLADLKEGPARDQRELALQVTLGSVNSSIKGFAAPDVQESFARALAACERIGDAPQLFWVLYGLWRFHFMRADYDKSLELGQQLIRLAKEKKDAEDEPLDDRLAAFFTVGATLMSCGRFVEALEMLERAIAIDRRLDRVHHDAAYTGQDSGVASRCWAAMTLWFLGYPDRARRYSEEAIALADSVGHPFSQTYALCISGFLAYYRRDRESLRSIFDEVVAQARAQGSWWESIADTFFGWADAERPRIQRGFDAHVASGARLQRPQILAALAEVALGQGQAGKARRDLEQAQAAIDETGERYYEAEVLRLSGEVCLLEDSGRRRAEEYFRRSLAVAERQGCRAFALRTATSLARLLSTGDRSGEAGALLARIHGSFTEGGDTPDLKDARNLLDALRQGNEVAS